MIRQKRQGQNSVAETDWQKQSQGFNQILQAIDNSPIALHSGIAPSRGQLQGQRHGRFVASTPQPILGSSRRLSQVPMSYVLDHNPTI